MPTHEDETLDGMDWIQAAFERVSERMNKPYQSYDWQGFTFYVLLEGEERRRWAEFTQAEIDDCAHDVNRLVRFIAEGRLESMLKLAKPGGIEL